MVVWACLCVGGASENFLLKTRYINSLFDWLIDWLIFDHLIVNDKRYFSSILVHLILNFVSNLQRCRFIGWKQFDGVVCKKNRFHSSHANTVSTESAVQLHHIFLAKTWMKRFPWHRKQRWAATHKHYLMFSDIFTNLSNLTLIISAIWNIAK